MLILFTDKTQQTAVEKAIPIQGRQHKKQIGSFQGALVAPCSIDNFSFPRIGMSVRNEKPANFSLYSL